MAARAPHTLCLRSSDASRLAEGTYQWQLQASHFKSSVYTKAFLASIELPMSQWSIETAWQRVYVTERLVVASQRRRLQVVETVLRRDEAPDAMDRAPDSPDSPPLVADVELPLHLNPIVRLWAVAGRVHLQTAEPHGLDAAVLRWVLEYEEHVKAIATAADVIDVSAAWAEGRLEVASPTLLVLTPKTAQPPSLDATGGYLHVPSPPTPAALASLLTAKLRASPFGRRIELTFDVDDCAFLLSLGAYPTPEATQVRLQASGGGGGGNSSAGGNDGLAALLGFGPQTARLFARRSPMARTQGYASASGRGFLQQHVAVPDLQTARQMGDDAPPLTLRGDASALFGHVQLRPGWYAPSQRIYSTSPPLRLQEEWELQFARLFFPKGDEPPRGIVFADPFGVNRIAELAPGLYTLASLAAYLQELMNADADGYAFSVTFEGGRFAFACASASVSSANSASVSSANSASDSSSASGASESDERIGLAFSLHFAHPRSIDPAKLGFEAAYLEGSDRYESSSALHEATTPLGGRLRNLYQISEVHGQRRFCIRPSAPPNVIGLVQAYDAPSRTLTLKCVTPSKAPAAHGLHAGAVVTLGAAGVVEASDGTKHESVPKGTLTTGVVRRGTESGGVVTLDVEVAPVGWVAQAAQETQCVGVAQPTEPCSFSFSPRLAQSVGGERLGFRSTTLQWGLDGVVRTRKLSVPPFISSGSHNLDHVDYVLMKIRECQKSTLIQSETGGHATGVFGKVCLNPTFRHERHLPVEVSFSGGDRLDTLTLEVCNPDGTPYHFHEAGWSLSISFVSE